MQLNAHVDRVLMERGRATGVVLKSGQVIKARKVGFWTGKALCHAGLLSAAPVQVAKPF